MIKSSGTILAYDDGVCIDGLPVTSCDFKSEETKCKKQVDA